jgi:peptide deformylase
MFLSDDITKEGNPVLREKCKEVTLPLSNDDLETLKGLHEYELISQIDELVKKYKIRPGVGIAAPQVGVAKRMFAIEMDDFLNDNKHYSFCCVNPKIIERSKEMTYLPGGEGCLSVDRDTCGVVLRNNKIVVKTWLYDFNTNKLQFKTLRLEGYPAIVFQHEYDHLDGIMFVDKLIDEDKIDHKNQIVFPLYTIEEDLDEDELEENA